MDHALIGGIATPRRSMRVLLLEGDLARGAVGVEGYGEARVRRVGVQHQVVSGRRVKAESVINCLVPRPGQKDSR